MKSSGFMWSLLGVCALASAGETTGVTGSGSGGLIVCIGEKALDHVSRDWNRSGCTFHCLEITDASVNRVRQKIIDAGCHGKVSAARFDGQHLPYVDNLVTRIVIGSATCEVPSKEIARALAPYGTAIAPRGAPCLPSPAQDVDADWAVYKKPYPDAMDEWPQRLHGADNNCVSRDRVVGPPRHVQWVSTPPWLRAHIGAPTVTCMVSSGGRLFTIEDAETAENPLLPAHWKLVARDAFNGIVLWTLDYPTWEQVTAHMSSYHTQMQRRLVAIGDTVYATPGLAAPVTALDAASGKVLKEFEGTARTQEFVCAEGRLYAMVGDRMNYNGYMPDGKPTFDEKGERSGGNDERTPTDPAEPKPAVEELTFEGNGFPLRFYSPRTPNVGNPTCAIVALDLATGKELWRSGKILKYTGCSMGLKGKRLVYQSTQGVFCLDAETGREIWTVRKEILYGTGDLPNTVVLGDDAIYSEEGKQVYAYSLADGSDYWGKALPAKKGAAAPTDLLIAAGALWMCGECNDPLVVRSRPTAYSLKTGEVIKVIPQMLSKPMGHDRCYRNFITERFFIDSKTGGPDCLDFSTDAEYPASFTRGSCSTGPLPCNGLIYCGPWSCQCHIPTGLHYFNAFSTDEESLSTKGQLVKVERSVRLEKGEAYGSAIKAGNAPWPTYRQDARRYSATRERVSAKGLARSWTTELRQALSAPVIADGKVFVAEKETYILRALDAGTGKSLWAYVAGGRIDSPPTYHEGLVLFGSCDGWVHCVRASDGALVWRFRDLPDRLISAFDRLESAWPIHGSILVKEGTAYFCAGRSSFLDGGIFIYGLDPATGKLLHQRQYYGPYGKDGFPTFVEKGDRSETEVILGNTADILSSEGGTLYIRHQALNPDLSDGTPGTHLLASSGMLEAQRNHREYKLVAENFNHRKMWTSLKTPYPTGDIIVSNGTDYYTVFGLPVNRGQSWNPRGGYTLTAKTRTGNGWSEKWQVKMPMTGKAMVLADDTVFVAGAPMIFPLDDLAGTYAGRRGAVMRAISVADGSTRAEYALSKLPVWDGMAAAYGSLFIVFQDGSVERWSE